jgi:hypothetical protein
MEKRTKIKSKVTYQTILDLCESKNWTTLEKEYINANTTMQWKCKICNNVWSSNYNNTRKRSSCPSCGKGKVRHTPENVKRIAKEKGFELLDDYIQSSKNNMWRCMDCSYIWSTSFANINRDQRNKGCPKCNGQVRYKYQDILQIAKERDLTCLDPDYENCCVHMKWQCNRCERIWETSFRSIKQNIGCIKCTFDTTIKCGIEDVLYTIKNRNIECLDEKYINAHTKMNWKCTVCDNIWKATYTHIKHSKSGCPNCAAYRSQKACRKIFEKIMGEPFPTLRPKFLKGLEYDGYNSELKLAFEYQGIQHYRFVPFFQKEITTFEQLLQNDAEKKKLSSEHGITLIEIPYQYTYKDKHKMFTYIMEKLEEAGLAFRV